jgi:DNA repair photolyase
MGKLNKSKGNMYEWVTHTWSPISGCPHQCAYCYVRKFKNLEKEVTLDLLVPDLGEGKTIFVAHMGDLFADSVPQSIIYKVLEYCRAFDNEYVFQTKNPRRLWLYRDALPSKSIIGTTIETNDNNLLEKISNAPAVEMRSTYLRCFHEDGFKTFLTIEPILDFVPTLLFDLIDNSKADFINIGADSKGHGLKEPSAEKIKILIQMLNNQKIEIKKKDNLERLMKGADHVQRND